MEKQTVHTGTSKTLAVNITSQLAAMAFGRIFGAVAGIALVRYLGVELQGTYSYLVNTILIFGFIAEFGMTHMLVREAKISGAAGPKLLGNALIVQLLQTALALGALAVFTLFFEKSGEIKGYMIYAAPAFMILYLANPFQAALNSYEKMYFTGLAQAIASIMNAAAIFTVIFLKLEIRWLIILLGLSNILNTAVSYALCRRFAINPELRPDIAQIKKLLAMSIPFGFAGVFGYIFLRVDVLLLYNLAGPYQAGLYSGVVRVMDIINAVLALIVSPVYPRLSYVFASEGREKFLKIVNLTVKYMAAATAPFVVAAVFYSSRLTVLVLGPEFEKSAPALAVLVSLAFIAPVRGIFTYAMNAAKLTAYVTCVFAAAAAVNITLNAVMIPRFGFVSTAAVNIGTNILAVAGLFVMFNIKVAKTGLIKFMPKALLSAGLMALCLYLARGMNMYAALAAGFSVYAAGLVLTGCIGKGEAEIVRNIFSKSKAKDKENGGEVQ